MYIFTYVLIHLLFDWQLFFRLLGGAAKIGETYIMSSSAYASNNLRVHTLEKNVIKILLPVFSFSAILLFNPG